MDVRVSGYFALSTALAASFPTPAYAEGRTGSFDVQIRILPYCAASTGFLGSEEGSEAEKGQGRISINCSGNIAWSVHLSEGTGADATTSGRKMTSVSGETEDYRITMNSRHSTKPGDQTISGSGPAMIIPIFDSPNGDIISIVVTY